MIYIQSVTLQHFRGAKRLTLTPDRKNLAIGGNNGTGKSGVVDGVEFALTGNITRLTGKGAGSLSIKTHGPHVDMRDQPENAIVVVVAFVPTLNKTITIERRVHAPKEVVVTPNDPDVQAVMAKLANHPEFALSRREILKYILTEPSERSKAVQALLKLEEVEGVRASLQSISNSCTREAKKQDGETQRARTRLLEALGVEELKSELILEAVNERRKVLNLAPLSELTKDTSLKEGLANGAGAAKSKVVKATALADLANIKKAVEGPDSEEVAAAVERISEIYTELHENPAMLKNLKQRTFLKSGLDLVLDDECPLCETEWSAEELRALLKRKLAEAAATQKLKTELDTQVAVIADAGVALADLVRAAAGYAKQFDAKQDMAVLTKWESDLRALETALTSLEKLAESQALLNAGWRQHTAEATAKVQALKDKCDALPDASKEDEARDFLVLGQERLEVYRKALRQHKMWKDRADLAGKAVAHYGAASNGVLGAIYDEVQQDFTRYYQIINQDDEANFKGRLSPTTGKLGFEVDFYGRGFQHPAAYHSEGHQDGMGLCLYLALMKRVLGSEFTFAVLDDVLTSVDAGHRKEVCNLLKTEFPNTQFLITTHEEVWLQHMITAKLVTNKLVVRFRKWTVDDGPLVWDQKEVWTEIAADLDQGNVPGASHSLRRYLEYISHELSDKLRVTVEYRSGGYDLGDLLPAVTSRLGAHFTKAKDAAQSWKQTAQFDRIRLMHDNFKRKLEKSQVEQWAINKTVHYNQWAQLQKQDFQPVAEAFKELLACFKCAGCDCYYYVSPSKGTAEILRCDCGDVNFNLKKNPDAVAPGRSVAPEALPATSLAAPQ